MDSLPPPGERVVVITGAATGIGRAIAERFVAAGDNVVLAYYEDSGTLPELVNGHPRGPAAAHILHVDVREIDACAGLVAEAERRFGRVDVLVTSAGVAFWGPSHEFSWDRYEQLLSTNLRGTYACIRAALPGMVERKSGRIITISSEVALVGMAEAAVYAATKGAVIAMTKSLAREYAPHGVLINSVAPGPTHTPLLDTSPEADDPAVKEQVPLRRFGMPSEIAGAVAMLAGPDGSFFVGQIVSPNGGAAI
jgi:NAD(P)-dependent dehydrogenase (short-subunit alcohol dehydrogenase family)